MPLGRRLMAQPVVLHGPSPVLGGFIGTQRVVRLVDVARRWAASPCFALVADLV